MAAQLLPLLVLAYTYFTVRFRWLAILILSSACADPERDRGSGPSLNNHKKYRVFSNTGPDPLKNHKATKPAFNVGQSSARQRNAI